MEGFLLKKTGTEKKEVQNLIIFYFQGKCQIHPSDNCILFQTIVWRILKKGQIHMNEEFELNRLEFMILETLYEFGSKDRFHGLTITEILTENEGSLGARMTVYKKMKKLVNAGYIAKGAVDNHADTFYLLNKSIKTIEGGKEV